MASVAAVEVPVARGNGPPQTPIATNRVVQVTAPEGFLGPR